MKRYEGNPGLFYQHPPIDTADSGQKRQLQPSIPRDGSTRVMWQRSTRMDLCISGIVVRSAQHPLPMSGVADVAVKDIIIRGGENVSLEAVLLLEQRRISIADTQDHIVRGRECPVRPSGR
jgi:hypothetical protein